MGSQYIEVDVSPKLLRWARESIGLSIEEIAEKMKVSNDRIVHWENGDERLSYSKLKHLARYYHRPTVIFFLDEPPEEPTIPKDFRMLDPSNPQSLKPNAILAVRSAWQRQYDYAELIEDEEIEYEIKLPMISLNENPEETGIIIRNKLNVSIAEQEGWESDNYSYEEWKRIIESCGILVMQKSWDKSDGRAFSITQGVIPIIVINTKDQSTNSRIFSLMHELAHIQLNISGICNPGYLESSINTNRARDQIFKIERYCNHFAGSLIVPMKDLRLSPRVKTSTHPQDWDEDRLARIGNDFHVSKEVILRRLLIGNHTTKKNYLEHHKKWKSRKLPSPGRVSRDYAKECIINNGERFTNLVINSYESNRIPLSDVSDILNVKLNYFTRIEKILHGEN